MENIEATVYELSIIGLLTDSDYRLFFLNWWGTINLVKDMQKGSETGGLKHCRVVYPSRNINPTRNMH